MATHAVLLSCVCLLGVTGDASDASAAAPPAHLRGTEPGAAKEFDSFKRARGRAYGSAAEEAARFQRFQATLRRAQDLNAMNGAEPAFGIGYSADFFEEELDAAFSTGHVLDEGDLASLQLAPRGGPYGRRLEELPPVVNWRRTKAVTAVKTQGACGACWAFSAAEEMESLYILHVDDGFQEVFSPQQITSCAGGNGCGGGSIQRAWGYIINDTTIGLSQEVFWPYMQGFTPQTMCLSKKCTASCSARNLTDIIAHQFLIGPYATAVNAFYAIPHCPVNGTCEEQDLRGLASALNTVGPLSVVVNADRWIPYVSGVMTREACGNITLKDMTHIVQLVGYNMSAPMPYWIVRNSWTTNWGDHGYIYLEMGKNTCGIANLVTFPLVASSEDGRQKAGFDKLYREALGL